MTLDDETAWLKLAQHPAPAHPRFQPPPPLWEFAPHRATSRTWAVLQTLGITHPQQLLVMPPQRFIGVINCGRATLGEIARLRAAIRDPRSAQTPPPRTLSVRVADLERRLQEIDAARCPGCVCPPGAERTCRGPLCPRRPLEITSTSRASIDLSGQNA